MWSHCSLFALYPPGGHPPGPRCCTPEVVLGLHLRGPPPNIFCTHHFHYAKYENRLVPVCLTGYLMDGTICGSYQEHWQQVDPFLPRKLVCWSCRYETSSQCSPFVSPVRFRTNPRVDCQVQGACADQLSYIFLPRASDPGDWEATALAVEHSASARKTFAVL